MSLSHARGPLSGNPRGWFSAPMPDGVVYVEPHPRRIQAIVGDYVIIDTEEALLVHEPGKPLAYAFPLDVAGLLPQEPVPQAPGYVRVAWDAVDAWYEEGRRLVHYPPNPYHRVDCRQTTRTLRVEVGGAVLVDADLTVVLFETGIVPRLYVDRGRVRTDLLVPSDTVTYCNYKGYTTYWNAVVDGVTYPDVAWSYDDPLPESSLIKGMFSFEPANANVVAQVPGDD